MKNRKSIKLYKVEDGQKVWHMTKEEIESSEDSNFRVLSMLGYCPRCGNFSTESDLDGSCKDKIVCVLCGHERSFMF